MNAVSWPRNAGVESATATPTRPDDFDDYWAEAIADSRKYPVDVRLTRAESPLRTIEVYDVTFAGSGGEPVRAWLRLPANGPRAGAIVEFVGYGGGRGEHIENLLWSSAGYVHLIMDARGQGSNFTIGHTPDAHGSGPSVPGFTTKGILDRHEYYYRRLIVDAVRAVEALRSLDEVGPSSIAVYGVSQGGGIGLAVAGLVEGLAAVVAKVPFLCDIPQSITLAEEGPYLEIVSWLRMHTGHEDTALRTLSYVDGVNSVQRATAPALISVALMDLVCPAPGVQKAAQNYGGPVRLRTWPYGGHGGGGTAEDFEVLAFLDEIMRGN